MTRVAIYARVSTDGKGQDEANQLDQMRAFIGAHPDWSLDPSHEYIDHVSAGGSKLRPEFARMFEDARRRRFDMVLFWSLDRFSREGVLKTLEGLNLLTVYGCGWRSLTEQYLDSTGIFKEAIIAILAAVAKQERVRISERTKAGLARVRKAGKKLGRPEVQVDRGRLRQLRQQGYGVRKIAEQMGLKKTLVHEILTEEGLAGPLPDRSLEPEEPAEASPVGTPDPAPLQTHVAESADSVAAAPAPETRSESSSPRAAAPEAGRPPLAGWQ